MSSQTLTRGRRLLTGTTVAALTAGVLAFTPSTAQAADPSLEIGGGTITWGLKKSFRDYLKMPFVGSETTATAPATDNGTVTTFNWARGSWANDGASVGTQGSISFSGHDGAMNFTLSDPRIVVSGTDAQLVVDAIDSDAVTHTDLAFADIDLTGTVTADAAGVTISSAPTKITAAGAAILSNGGSAFYPAETSLDPISAQFSAPTVSLSQTAISASGSTTITVTGAGFNPDAAVGTHPPFAGGPSGYYVVFGKFADQWRPSENAPGSSRKNTSQKWALPQASYDTLLGLGGTTAAQAVLLQPNGSFTTELTVSKVAIDAAATDPTLTNYGIYTYAGGGDQVAAAETYTPVSFVAPAPTTTGLTTTYGKGGTVKVTAPVAGKVTVASLGTKNAAAGATVAFTVSKKLTAGTRNLKMTLVPADTSLTAPAATTVTVKIAKAKAAKAKFKLKKKPTTRKKGKAIVQVRGVAGANAPTGKVRIKLTKGKKSKVVNVKLAKNGKRTVKLPKLAKGKWTVRVAYLGNANYNKRGYAKVGKIKITK